MYWETCRLSFVAIGLIVIMHLILQICEEKETLRRKRLELRAATAAAAPRRNQRRVRFADEAFVGDVVTEEEDGVPVEEEEHHGSSDRFVNDGVEVNIVPEEEEGDDVLPVQVKMRSSPASSKKATSSGPAYYDDLKKELQKWVQQENTSWAAGATSQQQQAPTPSHSTPLASLAATSTGAAGAPVNAKPDSALPSETARNVNLKISMLNEAARHADIPNSTGTAATPSAADANMIANVVPGSDAKDGNIMNSGELGGGLSAWDAMGSSFGSALGSA